MRFVIFALMIFGHALPVCCAQNSSQSWTRTQPSHAINVRITENTARISVRGGVGTASIISETNSDYLLLSNAHVVGYSTPVSVEFQKIVDSVETGGIYTSRKFTGQVIARQLIQGRSIDRALIAVSKSQLNGVKLPVIPLSRDPSFDDRLLVTCGCRGGQIQRGNFVTVVSYDRQNGTIRFKPSNQPGDSGSALYSRDGLSNVGLNAWKSGGGYLESEGIAQDADSVRRWVDSVLQGRTQTSVVEVSANIGNLPDGFTAIGMAEDPPTNVRWDQTPEASNSCNPWNGNCPVPPNDQVPEPPLEPFPEPQPEPAQPKFDVSPIVEQIESLRSQVDSGSTEIVEAITASTDKTRANVCQFAKTTTENVVSKVESIANGFVGSLVSLGVVFAVGWLVTNYRIGRSQTLSQLTIAPASSPKENPWQSQNSSSGW